MVRNVNDRSNDAGAGRGRRRAEARRLEILRAAARVFRRRGYADTGMRDIAAEAELSSGNLYHYFSGKHEILYFCQDRSLDTLLAAVERARLSGQPRAEQLRQVIRAHVLCLLDEVEGSAAHLELDALPADLREAIVRKRDRYERELRRLVEDGVGAGEFRDCDARLVTRAILGAVNWTVRWYRADGPRSPGSVGDALADYLLGGLTADGIAPPRKGRARSGGAR
jgi:AcrR family transcriptional regulator